MAEKFKTVVKKQIKQEKELQQQDKELQQKEKESRRLEQYKNANVRKRCMGSFESEPIINYDINIQYSDVPTLPNMEDENTRKFNYEQLDNLEMTRDTKSIFNFKSKNDILYRNIYKNIDENTSLIQFENLLDNDWMKNQFQYIAELSKRDLFTIYSYTRTGDRIANSFLRKTFKPISFLKDLKEIEDNPQTYRPYFALFFQAYDKLNEYTEEQISEILSVDILPEKKSQIHRLFLDKSVNLKLSEQYVIFLGLLTCFSMEFWLKIIGIYVKDIDRIIKNAPKITKKMYVYRGVDTNDYFLTNIKDHIKSLNGFESTSVKVKTTFEFIGRKCCLQRITLLPNVRALLISCVSAFPLESEILLGHQTNYYVMDQTSKINKSLDPCALRVEEIEAYDIIILGNDYPSTYCPNLNESECAEMEKCLWDKDICRKK